MLEKEAALGFSPALSFPFQPGTLLQLEHVGVVRTSRSSSKRCIFLVRGRLRA